MSEKYIYSIFKQFQSLDQQQKPLHSAGSKRIGCVFLEGAGGFPCQYRNIIICNVYSRYSTRSKNQSV